MQSGLEGGHGPGVQRRFQRVLRALAFEARIAHPKHDALHAQPAAYQREAVLRILLIIDAGRRVHQMDRRKIAFAAPRRRNAAHAADRDGARRDALRGQRREHRVERDAMTAGDYQVGRPPPSSRFA